MHPMAFAQTVFLMSCAVGNAPDVFLVDAAMFRDIELIRTAPDFRVPGSKQKQITNDACM